MLDLELSSKGHSCNWEYSGPSRLEGTEGRKQCLTQLYSFLSGVEIMLPDPQGGGIRLEGGICSRPIYMT